MCLHICVNIYIYMTIRIYMLVFHRRGKYAYLLHCFQNITACWPIYGFFLIRDLLQPRYAVEIPDNHKCWSNFQKQDELGAFTLKYFKHACISAPPEFSWLCPNNIIFMMSINPRTYSYPWLWYIPQAAPLFADLPKKTMLLFVGWPSY